MSRSSSVSLPRAFLTLFSASESGWILTAVEFVVISSCSAVCPIVVQFALLDITNVTRGEGIVVLVLWWITRFVFIDGENAAIYT